MVIRLQSVTTPTHKKNVKDSPCYKLIKLKGLHVIVMSQLIKIKNTNSLMIIKLKLTICN